LVYDRSIIATGYNGPPRSIDHCKGSICPRQKAGFGSGKGLSICPASHAEINTICNAARMGVCTRDTTMYMTCGIPCKDCLKYIINAGVRELVCTSLDFYDTLSPMIVQQVKDRRDFVIRTFVGL
jgi:dCMP deaminase